MCFARLRIFLYLLRMSSFLTRLISNRLLLPGLQREVRREPSMALDGGADGLDFYRAILKRWLRFLRPGGMIAVECGLGQAAYH